MHYFSEIKSFCPIQNNHPRIDQIKKLNSRNNALPIATYGFSALYANILQNKLKNVMRELINFCFKGIGKQLFSATKFGTTWTDN